MKTKRKIRYVKVDEKHCAGCGSCMKVCPRDAIQVLRGIYAEVDIAKCAGCGLCEKACPASVIEIIHGEVS